MAAISGEWANMLKDEFNKDYYRELYTFVKAEYNSTTVYPSSKDLFNAFEYTPFENVKVVILGQDPYHEPGQAHGLSFSVKPGVPAPPSLVNIYKELSDDLGCFIPDNGYLVKWAKQGVLLLNTVLTVRAHDANSHKGRGWEQFTDSVIKAVNKKDTPVVFILWGAPAGRKADMLDASKHMIIKSPHPSPLSSYRGFFGSKPFSKANDFLIKNGIEPIDWQIPNLADYNL